MSKQAAQQFRDMVSKTPQLQQQVREAIEAGQDLAAAVAMGKQHGCEFTIEEAAEVLQNTDSDELSESELDVVAGGAQGSPPGGHGYRPGGPGHYPRPGANRPHYHKGW